AAHAQAAAAAEAGRQLELAGGLAAPVHRHVGAVAERRHLHRAPVDDDDLPLAFGRALGPHDAAAVEVAVVAHEAARGEERQALAQARQRTAQGALYVVDAGRREAAQVLEAPRLARQVVARVGADGA